MIEQEYRTFRPESLSSSIISCLFYIHVHVHYECLMYLEYLLLLDIIEVEGSVLIGEVSRVGVGYNKVSLFQSVLIVDSFFSLFLISGQT